MSASTHDDGKAFWNMVKSDDGEAHQYSETTSGCFGSQGA